jgi:hypothetical protein
MSYVSLLRNIPEFLSQPTGIAAIASLGIHGAIALLLPIVPIESKPKQEASSKSSVGLVELSQAEQNRLPQPGTPQSLQAQAPVLPQVPPPNFATQSIPSLPPMPPAAASTDLILPPLPKTNNVTVASLPRSQPLPVLSQKELQYNPSFSTNVKPFPRYQERVKLGEPKPLASSNIPYSVPPEQAAEVPQEQEMVNTAAPVSSEPMPVPYSSGGNTATQTPEVATEVSPARQQLVTPVIQPPLAGDNSIALRGQNLPQLPQGANFKVPRLPSLTPESPAQVTEQLASKPKTFVERFSEVKQQYPNLETKQLIAETVSLAKVAEESNVEGDLIVNGEGRVESINFRDNAVSSDLKTSVREYFREYFQKNPAQANGKPKFYPFNISFKSESNNISKTSLPTVTTSSQVNQTQPKTEAQRSLIQRLRPVAVGSQSSQKPQKTNLTESVRPVEVNALPSKEPQTINQTRRLRPEGLNQLSQNTQIISAPQANQERQVSRQQVIQRQTTAAPQANQEQQTSQQQVVIRQSTSTAQGNQEQTSRQEVSSNESANSVESSKKLLRQLRQFRDKRQGNNPEK